MKNPYYKELLTLIKTEFPKHSNIELAGPMKAYMKNHFEFLGIKMPTRKAFLKQIHESVKKLEKADLFPLMHELWKEPYREYHYVAMDISKRFIKKITAKDVPDIQQLITTNSWWDTVDFLAANLLGAALKNDQKLQYSYSDELINSDNMWLRRSAILFQLKYKNETDFELLQAHIIKTMGESEFFIRKAAGWTLREYSKTNPAAVGQFIDNYRSQLSNLTIREGSKYL